MSETFRKLPMDICSSALVAGVEQLIYFGYVFHQNFIKIDSFLFPIEK